MKIWRHWGNVYVGSYHRWESLCLPSNSLKIQKYIYFTSYYFYDKTKVLVRQNGHLLLRPRANTRLRLRSPSSQRDGTSQAYHPAINQHERNNHNTTSYLQIWTRSWYPLQVAFWKVNSYTLCQFEAISEDDWTRMWTAKLLQGCMASPGKQQQRVTQRAEMNHCEPNAVSPTSFSSQEADSWNARGFDSSSGSVARCCLDSWYCNRLRLCLIQVPGARCLAAAKLILLRARCSSDPKGNMRHQTRRARSKLSNVSTFDTSRGHFFVYLCNHTVELTVMLWLCLKT